MPAPDAVRTRSLAHVGSEFDRTEHLHARIQCVDGRNIEGEILDVGEASLIVLDGSCVRIHLRAEQLQTLDIGSPRRVREWLLAICAIPVVTGILVAFSRIPGVNPDRGDITIGFTILLAVVWVLGRVPGLGKLFRRQLTRWDRVYPLQGA